jgi:hypothetical protein
VAPDRAAGFVTRLARFVQYRSLRRFDGASRKERDMAREQGGRFGQGMPKQGGQNPRQPSQPHQPGKSEREKEERERKQREQNEEEEEEN